MNPKINRYHIVGNDGGEQCIEGTHHEIRGDWLYVYIEEIITGSIKIRPPASHGGLVKRWWVEEGG